MRRTVVVLALVLGGAPAAAFGPAVPDAPPELRVVRPAGLNSAAPRPIPDHMLRMSDADLAVAYLTAASAVFLNEAGAVALAIASGSGVRNGREDARHWRRRRDQAAAAIEERGYARAAGLYQPRAGPDCAVLGEMPFGGRVRIEQEGFRVRLAEVPDGGDPVFVIGLEGAAAGGAVAFGDPRVGFVLFGPVTPDGATLRIHARLLRNAAGAPIPPEDLAAIQRCRLTLTPVAEAAPTDPVATHVE